MSMMKQVLWWAVQVQLVAFAVAVLRFSWQHLRSNGGTFGRSMIGALVVMVIAVICLPVWAAEQIVLQMPGRR